MSTRRGLPARAGTTATLRERVAALGRAARRASPAVRAVACEAWTAAGAFTDRAVRRRADQRLRESQEHFRLLVEGVRDYAIIMLDPDGRVVSSNSGAERIKGYRAEGIIGCHFSRFYPPEAIAQDEPTAHLRLAGQQGRLQLEGWRVCADGSRFWADTVITALFTDAGQLRGYANVSHDASERRRLELELRRLALHDSLTGLPNRTLLRDRLEQALRGAEREKHGAALLFIDLDHFKRINDTLGHQVGDLVLQDVAGRIRSVVRATDTVARLGGDEFAVVLPQMAGPHDAETVAAKILAALAEPLTVGVSTLKIGASIGIAVYPLHADSEALLLRRADIAMYRAKHLGVGFASYAEHYNGNTVEWLQTIPELHSAIEAGQLVLHYQPKFDLATGKAVAMEALVRWEHPQRGLLLPASFIPIAEETGLVKPLTAWVVKQALADRQRWARDLPIDVAVNVSPRTLQDPSIVETITAALHAAQAPAGRLQLEITETTLTDRAGAYEAMCALGEAGVRFAIDDFGTGYSSMARLLDLPVEEIKIDRSFVADMSSSTRATSIVRAMIDLGDNLGLRVVAEGIEDHHTHQHLQHLGCQCGQGFLLHVPAPLEDLIVDLS